MIASSRLDPEADELLIEVFGTAQALAGDARERYLAGIRDRQPELADEVLMLLHHDAARGSFLEHPIDNTLAFMLGELTETEFGDLSDPERVRRNEDPEQIGRYRVTGVLGEGGMGRVYEGEDGRLGRRVAIKLLPPELTNQGVTGDTLEQEARLLAAFNHPNIATIYSLEEADGRHFFTLERILGGTLRDRLQTGPLPVAETIRIAQGTARALEAAHQNGIVHCDLKPGNVAITQDGLVKVLDFGIAQTIESARGTGSAATHGFRGTPSYAAPEQVMCEPVDARTDLWAFGCILFECLTGRVAFPCDSPLSLLLEPRSDGPGWEALPQEVPAELRALAQQCLEVERDRRPRGAAEVRRVLDELIARENPLLRADAAGELPGPRTGLPRPAASFVGRARLIEELHARVLAHPLVTLTGIGGCGKTSLAIEAARRLESEFPDGACWIELASLQEPERVAHAFAAAAGVRERAGRPLIDSLVDALRARRALLVVDNCEHLLGACAQICTAILRAAAGVRILATSREGLGLSGEWLISVPSLELPPEGADVATLCASEAAQLLLTRARALSQDFEVTEENAAAITRICRQLDGIPLAIEMAARRVRAMEPDEIARRLSDRFRFLTGGSRAIPRQQTLRNVFDWSYDLLSPEEQLLLKRLSVFRGSFTLAAVECVCAGDGIDPQTIVDLLTGLVEKSLVQVRRNESGEGIRYTLLETVRQYAEERLLAEDAITHVRAHYQEYFYELVMRSRTAAAWSESRVTWLLFDRERENIHAALLGLMETDGARAREQALRLAARLEGYWDLRGDYSYAEGVYDRLLEKPSLRGVASDLAAFPSAVAAASYSAGNMAMFAGNYPLARSRFQRALAINRQLQDRSAMAADLNSLGNLSWRTSDYEAARGYFAESLSIQRELGNARQIAGVLGNLGVLAERVGNYEQALALHKESLAMIEELGDRRGVAVQLNNLGVVTMDLGDFAGAREYHERCLAERQALGDVRGIILAQQNLASVIYLAAMAARGADVADAADAIAAAERLCTESLVSSREHELVQLTGEGLTLLTHIAVTRGERAAASASLGEAIASVREVGERRGALDVLVAGARYLARFDSASAMPVTQSPAKSAVLSPAAARVYALLQRVREQEGLVDSPVLRAIFERDLQTLPVAALLPALEEYRAAEQDIETALTLVEQGRDRGSAGTAGL